MRMVSTYQVGDDLRAIGVINVRIKSLAKNYTPDEFYCGTIFEYVNN